MCNPGAVFTPLQMIEKHEADVFSTLTDNDKLEFSQPYKINEQYLAKINADKKVLFDEFCRGNRIYIQHNGMQIETTVAQLNLFKWFIGNKIFYHLQEIYVYVQDHMKKHKSLKKTKSTKCNNNNNNNNNRPTCNTNVSKRAIRLVFGPPPFAFVSGMEDSWLPARLVTPPFFVAARASRLEDFCG
jgi:phage antirepressor YoqD-like protein